MNSPFANIFNAILARIQAQVPEIEHISMDHGQLEGMSRAPLAFPCVLIDFANWTFSNLSQSAQMAEGDIVIKLAFAQYQQEDSLNEPQWRNLALQYLEIEWKLNKALHTWSPNDDTGALTRTFADKENRMGLRMRTLRYRLEMEDYSAQLPVTTTAAPTPIIST